MNGRAWVVMIPAVALAGAACGTGTSADDRLGDVRSSAETDLAECSSEPWTGGPRTCGTGETVHHRVTCAELGFGDSVTIVPSAPEASGDRIGAYVDPSGIESSLYLNNGEWGFGATVKPDGSTMTFDALVFTSSESDDSYVVRFTGPEFYLHNLPIPINTVDDIQLCGYRPGHAASLPPPPTPQFTIDCSGGSTSAPGATVESVADIHWNVSVTPTDASYAGKLSVFATTQDSAFQSGHDYTLTNGMMSGGVDSLFSPAVDTTIVVQFAYANAQCTMYWNVEGSTSSSSSSSSSSSGGSSSSSGGGGHAW